jgi:ferric-dicitrate binding protein FerR (iron transport regulator)
MRVLNPLVMFVSLAFAASVAAQDSTSVQVIDLKDGSRVELRADGSMSHYSTTGRPVPMADGDEMIARDGTRLLMKGKALWRQVVEQAAADYARASIPPWVRIEGDKRWIELAGGSHIELRGDGSMRHVDAAGKDVDMADGEAMIAKDGTKLLMNKGTLWGPARGEHAPQSAR